MKTTIVIGQEEKEEVRVKTYVGGGMVVDTGDSYTEIKGKKPVSEKNLKISKKDKEDLLSKPDSFKLSKGKLVKKGEKK